MDGANRFDIIEFSFAVKLTEMSRYEILTHDRMRIVCLEFKHNKGPCFGIRRWLMGEPEHACGSRSTYRFLKTDVKHVAHAYNYEFNPVGLTAHPLPYTSWVWAAKRMLATLVNKHLKVSFWVRFHVFTGAFHAKERWKVFESLT